MNDDSRRLAPGSMNASPLRHHLLPVAGALILTAVVDSVLVIPLVEIDPVLEMVVARGPLLEQLRSVAPTIAAAVGILIYAVAHALRLGACFRDDPTSARSREQVLRAPGRLGAAVAGGWLFAFAVGAAIDLMTVRFPVAGEAIAYYALSALAMGSTGLFGFLVTWIIVDAANRRYLVPVSFPDGFVSRDGIGTPVSITRRLVALWFGVSFFPLLVLGLGLVTLQYLPGNWIRALAFIAVFAPASLVIVVRAARLTQDPLRRLVLATREIASGSFDVSLRSTGNDDVGYLIDATVDMTQALAEKRLMTETFGRMVDPRVRDHLLNGSIALGGERRLAAVMFCDIRGFTSYSEHRSEDAVVAVLNEHLSAMENAVVGQGGMINKFLGDGFLALFGVPIGPEKPALAALTAALAILDAHAKLNRERSARGDETFAIGIGVHWGSVLAGTIGSHQRAEYTVIGDTVNLASRLEGLTKRFETPVIATEALVHAALGEIDGAVPGPDDRTTGNRLAEVLVGATVRPLDRVEIRGRTEPVKVWGLG